jgi:hypothetical protein
MIHNAMANKQAGSITNPPPPSGRPCRRTERARIAAHSRLWQRDAAVAGRRGRAGGRERGRSSRRGAFAPWSQWREDAVLVDVGGSAGALEPTGGRVGERRASGWGTASGTNEAG